MYLNQTIFSALPVAEGKRLTKEAFSKALALDPGNAQAYGGMAYLTTSCYTSTAYLSARVSNAVATFGQRQPRQESILAS